MASSSHELWVDKYKPRTVDQMCYPVFANKLKEWLINFYDMARSNSFEPKQPRGVLLSGPPGIGKTTTVHVVAEALGITVVEYNASDFRSKKSLHERVSDMTTNRGFMARSHSAFSTGNDHDDERKCGGRMQASTTTRDTPSPFWGGKEEGEGVVPMRGSGAPHPTAMGYGTMLLLMDEVDGCDIGGVGEIIQMLKTTAVPIVSTCNDRWHPKLRSLLNHVEDMRLTRPPCHIVANFLYDRVLAREGVTLSKPLLQSIVQQSGSDIRSMLNNLQMWCLHKNRLEQREMLSCAEQSTKTGDAGLFETAEYFLLQGTSRGEIHSIADMEKMYYNADLIDMFVQENYLHYNPFGTSATNPLPSFADRQRMGKDADGGTSLSASSSSSSYYALPAASISSWMAAVQVASDAISRGDAAHRMMYTDQNWSVSRAHVLLGSILPCAITRGKYETFCTGQQMFFDRQRPVKFPAWLGQNSSMGKNKRLLRCLTAQATHPRGGVSGNAEDVLLDYIPLALEPCLTRPLLPSFSPSWSSPSLSTATASPSPAFPSLSPLPTLPASPNATASASFSPSPEEEGSTTSCGGGGNSSSKRRVAAASQASAARNNTEGISAVLAVMEQYHLLRDDWDYVIQAAACFGNHPRRPLTRYSGGGEEAAVVGMWRPTTAQIPTATKSAFTRAANKKFGMTQSFMKSALRRIPGGVAEEEDDAAKQEEEEEEEEEDDADGASGKSKNTREAVGGVGAKDKKGIKAMASKECAIPGVKIVRMASPTTSGRRRAATGATEVKAATAAAPRKRANRSTDVPPLSTSSSAVAEAGAKNKKGPRQKKSPSGGSTLPRSSPTKPTAESRKRSRKMREEESSESSASSSSSSSDDEDSD